jgi:hypothetical protein
LKLKAKDMTSLWHGSMRKMFFATDDELDKVASIDTMCYDNELVAESMAFDFDMGRDLWLNKQRFTVLQRTYLEPYPYELFLERCESIGLGEAKRGVITQLSARQHPMSARKYRWGNCIMGWTFRGGDKYDQPVLTMHSRVSYIAYIGGLDLALCWVMASEIGNRIGKAPEDFKFRWVLDSAQFHGFKSLPLLYHRDYEQVLSDNRGYPSEKHPTIRLVRKWWEKVVDDYEAGKPLEEEKYGPLRRIKRRYAEYKAEDFLPNVPVEALNFDPLRKGR